MASDLLLPVAEQDGELVWARDLAASGSRPSGLTCVGCGESVLARLGEQRRAHFAHRAAVGCTTGGGGASESALHRSAIRVIAASIANAAHAGHPYVAWSYCQSCDVRHPNDLAFDTNLTVEIDRHLTSAVRPDVLVRDGEGNPVAAVEVVVHHDLEEGARDAYRQLGATVLRMTPTWEDLEELRFGIGRPGFVEDVTGDQESGGEGAVTVVNGCLLPRHLGPEDAAERPCPICSGAARVVIVEVAGGPCWKSPCDLWTQVLDVYALRQHRPVLIAAGARELHGIKHIGHELGIRMEQRFTHMAGTDYLVNVCDCGATLGDHFVYNGQRGEGYFSSPGDPVHRYVVCTVGHWTSLATQSWPVGATLGRPLDAIGLCGRYAGLFGSEDDDEPQISLTWVTSTDQIRDVARFMAYGSSSRRTPRH